ncbi:Stress up-regulated Nod 19 [Seminavis robusta]|uniref:Stress up-regulated Nod 19 n=1 Tax=Seminavis robusta TaxID=568900 RepID=A0A9N8DTY5_9STRA|nr:Stress up-regulated Nod 19 [Seminavis robusta]|eukprot:Sro349_g123510.1 Stress up-regulated Nod 19 (890) ;mRNA; f:44281-47035
MCVFGHRSLRSTVLGSLLSFLLLHDRVHAQGDAFSTFNTHPVTIVIGNDPDATPTTVGWTDGVCYQPIVEGVLPGDTLEFRYGAHNVYQMASKEHFMACNFSDATLLSEVGQTPFRFTIEDVYSNQLGSQTTFFFACQIGDHCASGTQKLQVTVEPNLASRMENVPLLLPSLCLELPPKTVPRFRRRALPSVTSELPKWVLFDQAVKIPCLWKDRQELTRGRAFRGLLRSLREVSSIDSLSSTIPSPWIIVWHWDNAFIFDFVVDDPNGEGVTPVPTNQLYIHHLAGRVVFAQGAESMGQAAPDAPFPEPYARFTGNDGGGTIFHLIDLREVDDWLSCIECRCPPQSGQTYLDTLTGTGNVTGGVSCCSNCTDLTGPTLDYRMRYNVTYRELAEEESDEPVVDVDLLVADIAPAVDMQLEYDVPSFNLLTPEHQAEGYIQRLERVAPFNEMFQVRFFAGPYNCPDEVAILRCVAHVHVAAVTQFLEDAETGERFCTSDPTYGTNPETNNGFVTAVSVDNHDPPNVIPANRRVRFVTEYNATHMHSGVMGYLFVFVAGAHGVTADEVDLTVPLCQPERCDVNLLPIIDMEPFQSDESTMVSQEGGWVTWGDAVDTESEPADANDEDCVDTLADSPSCTFGQLCTCEEFVNAPESTGCDGFFSSVMGDVEVRSVCAKYCGCTVSDAVNSRDAGRKLQSDCADTLADSPSCTFGGLCDCETFVNAPESEGCGGLYKSDWGDTVINEVCTAYCEACVAVPLEELFEEAYTEVMTLHIKELCKYDTQDCRTVLSNLLACGSGQPGIEDANPLIQMVVTRNGQTMAQDQAKLGQPSLHGGQGDQPVVPCSDSGGDAVGNEDSYAPVGNEDSYAHGRPPLYWALSVVAVVLFIGSI